MPDVFGARMNALFSAQGYLLIAAAIIAGMAFFSAHRLKGSHPPQVQENET
jgi:hypothetical protein